MTEIECLEKMVLVWEFRAEFPLQPVEDAYKALQLSADRSGCPCCEYTLQLNNGNCTECPLRELWGTQPCFASIGSPFVLWLDGSPAEQKQGAEEILAASRQKLEELKTQALLEGDSHG